MCSTTIVARDKGRYVDVTCTIVCSIFNVFDTRTAKDIQYLIVSSGFVTLGVCLINLRTKGVMMLTLYKVIMNPYDNTSQVRHLMTRHRDIMRV
jgi:hypothetical protein